jgi:hypothetical protein
MKRYARTAGGTMPWHQICHKGFVTPISHLFRGYTLNLSKYIGEIP